jgi:hypothetical protein
MRTPLPLAALTLGLTCAPALAQTTWYVDPAGSGAGGTSWPTAFTNLHAALSASASGDTIKIARGTYTPDIGHPSRPVGDRLAYWTYRAGVHVRGGYQGIVGAGSPDQHDPSSFPTVLSGEINDPGLTTDNSMTLMNANVTGLIDFDGLTFTGCYQDASAGLPQGHYGSALWTFGSTSITLNNCRFVGNTTINNDQVGRGGTVFIFNTPGTISSCVFLNNHIGGTQFQTVAAGLFIWQSDLHITNCAFDGNTNDASAGASYAGALYIEHGFPVIENCSFLNNSALSGGGAVFHRNAWQPPPNSLSNRLGAPTFINCSFENNHSNQGGAVWVWSIRPADIARFTNCVFTGNSTNQNGAAIFSNPGGASFMQVRIEGCQFRHNTSSGPTFATCYDGAGDLIVDNITAADNSAGRAISAAGTFVNVYNSIIRGPVGAAQPMVWTFNTQPTNVSYCNLEGATQAHWVMDHIQSAEPVFSNRPDGDFRLLFGSPCIDAGNNTLVPATLTMDLAGGARLSDDAFTPNTGVGSPPVDIGAFENITGFIDCTADFNCDGDVGTDADIEAFFACIAGTCPTPPCTSTADFNGDGDVGTDADIEAFFRVLSGGPCT